MRFIVLLGLLSATVLLPASSVIAESKVDFVLVSKTNSRLYLVTNGRVTESFPVVFGRNPVGPKRMRGDQRTPEGKYVLDYKKEDSDFYKAIHISYPNVVDMRAAKAEGLDPGDMIMIHGQKNGYAQYARVTQKENWTDGCIALTNEDMDRLWSAIAVPVEIEIVP